MKGRANLLFILLLWLLPSTGWGQGLPFAKFLTADAAWCELSDKHTVAGILVRENLVTVHGGKGISLFPLFSGGTNRVLLVEPGPRVYESGAVYVDWDGYINSG